MLNPPSDLSDDVLRDALALGWSVHAETITYRPVGFGSHHWEVTDRDGARWFVTVDEDPDLPRLRAAFASAADVPVAVAPLRTREGEPLLATGRSAERTVAVTLYPFMTGETFHFGDYRDDDHRRAALDLVIAVHRTPPRHALTDDLATPGIPEIGDAGPYSRRAAAFLTEHADTIAGLRARHDTLVTRVDPARMVLTHGEPHPGNTMRTDAGWRLIDWDTALIAPPERDLWHLATDETLATYEKAMGVRPDTDLLELYRLRWDLTDLAEVAGQFARPHTGDENDRMAWRILGKILTSSA